MRRVQRILAIAALVVGCVPHARADEIKLKDGSKIVGTIVGFEENAFRVKTSYGFALIQKDQVVSISVIEAEKKPEAEKSPEPAADKPAAPAKPAKSESANASAPAKQAPETVSPEPAANKSAPGSSTAPEAKPAVVAAATPLTNTASAPGTSKANAPTASKTGAAPAVTPSANVLATTAKNSVPPAATAPAATPGATAAVNAPPVKPAEPDPVKEEVSGNTYTNRTWGFQMYKPPDWQVIDGARNMLPGAITAMGTSDQKTYLLIGQEAAGKSLANDMDAIEGRLRDVLENYRSLGEKRVTVSGLSAIQHKFRGSIDNHDWSGIVVFIPRDTHLYTIFGMTYADSDLVQIQENVIARAISSVQFTKQ